MQRARRDRRRFLSDGLKAAGGFALAPALMRQAGGRPAIEQGVASGDVSGNTAVIWSRTDRPARMHVEWSTTASFANVRRLRGVVAAEASGFTARVGLPSLPAGQRIFYRVYFEDLADARNQSARVTGSFMSPGAGRDVSFAWSADTVGQGWGINLEWGGLRTYDAIRRAAPDFFVHCGDTIYADGPVPPEIRLADGSVWRNVVTPEKSKVAETLEEFRGNYRYNLLDEHVRRFNAEVSQVWLWDDHEVKNNWYPGMSLEADARYTLKDAGLLAQRARRAFLEYAPMRLEAKAQPPIYRSIAYGPLLEVFAVDLRTYRGPNSTNRQATPGPSIAHAGARQLAWLKAALRASTAVWKVIASDLPIGLVVRDGETTFEGIANADAGAPLGRELEIADLLRYLKRERIRNVVWVTGDVHYAAAHHYHPHRASFRDFDPFWEFVGGPLHAGTFGPNALDGTFGPEVRFAAVKPGSPPNQPPSAGQQFFGMARISAASRVMTVTLHDLSGTELYSVDLEPV